MTDRKRLDEWLVVAETLLAAFEEEVTNEHQHRSATQRCDYPKDGAQ